MLTIKIGDTLVDYRDDVDIPIVLRSPLFAEGKGSFIFNFQLPATDALKKELDYFHRAGRAGAAYIEKPLKLEFGPLKYSGVASISEADEDTYELSCPVDAGDLASILKETTLRGLDLGDAQITETTLSVKASSNNAYAYSDYSAEQLQEVVDIAFTVITENIPAGALNTNGMECIVTTAADVFIELNFNCNVILGIMNFRLYADSVLIETIELSGIDTKRLLTLQNFSGTLTWDLYVQNTNAAEPDMYEIDATLYAGSTLTIKGNSGLNLFTAAYPENNFVLFPFENKGMLDNVPDDVYKADNFALKDIYNNFFPVLNYFRDGQFAIRLAGAAEGEYFEVFNLINPFVYVAYIIKCIEQKFNIKIDNNLFEDDDLKQLILFNLFAENNYINADMLYIEDLVDLTKHVPDTEIATFWDNLCKLLGIGYKYNSTTRVLELKYLKDVASDRQYVSLEGVISGKPRLISDPLNGYKLVMEAGSSDKYITSYFKSLTGLTLKGTVTLPNDLSGITDMQVNDCYYVSLRKEYWYWNYDVELHLMNWILYSGDFALELKAIDSSISGKSFEVSSKMGTIMNNAYPFADLSLDAKGDERNWLIPSTNQAGNFKGLPAFIADYSLAVLFYHGLHNDSTGSTYPLASHGDKDLAGNVIHSLSLRWDGVNGLYEKRYKAWINLLLNSRGFFKVMANLSTMQLSQMDFFKWYTDGEYRFLIKEIRFNIKKDRISTAELEILIR